jgi:hypothetical protein
MIACDGQPNQFADDATSQNPIETDACAIAMA